MSERWGRAPLACAGVCLALMTACSQDRASGQAAVYDDDVAPIFKARCVSCHGDTNPAGGWRATSYLGAIACVAPTGAPATLPGDGRAPVLAALHVAPHIGLLDGAERRIVTSWVSAGTPAYAAGVHDPAIIDPRSPAFHGTVLRSSRWSAMLDPADPNACGRCHDGSLSRPTGVTQAAPGAPACTTCHDQAGGVLACSTCHGSGEKAYPPRDACFFPGDAVGSHAAHVESSPERAGGLACATCHPVPGSPVIGGLHGDGIVEVMFDSSRVGGAPRYDATTGACAVSCHDRGGAKAHVTWTDPASAIACGDCHGAPPAGHFTGACTGCHAEANAAGTALSGGPLHMNGQVDLGNGSGLCGACHGSGASPWPTTAAHPAHENPTLAEPFACSNCHVVPATILDPVHLDGTVHVTFSGLATVRGSQPVWSHGQCSNVSCHGASLPGDVGATPAWVDASGAPSKCGACHGIPPLHAHTPSASCNLGYCHGSEVTIDASGAPSVASLGKARHVDGIIESGR